MLCINLILDICSNLETLQIKIVAVPHIHLLQGHILQQVATGKPVQYCLPLIFFFQRRGKVHYLTSLRGPD